MKQHHIFELLFVMGLVAGCTPVENQAAQSSNDTAPVIIETLSEDDFLAEVDACGFTIKLGETTVSDLEEAGFELVSTEEVYPDNQIFYPSRYNMHHGKTHFSVVAYSPMFHFENVKDIPHCVIRSVVLDKKSESVDESVTYLSHAFTNITKGLAADWAALLQEEDVRVMEDQICLEPNDLDIELYLNERTGKTDKFVVAMDLGVFLDLQPNWRVN